MGKAIRALALVSLFSFLFAPFCHLTNDVKSLNLKKKNEFSYTATHNNNHHSRLRRATSPPIFLCSITGGKKKAIAALVTSHICGLYAVTNDERAGGGKLGRERKKNLKRVLDIGLLDEKNNSRVPNGRKAHNNKSRYCPLKKNEMLAGNRGAVFAIRH